MGEKKYMINFFYPWLLLLLPLPLVLRLLFSRWPKLNKFWPEMRVSQNHALELPTYTHLSQQIQTNQSSNSWHSLWQRIFPRSLLLPLLLWCLLLISLAQPLWLDKFQAQPMTGRDLMLLVDVSGSMRKMDFIQQTLPISRLEMVKKIASVFIENRLGDRVGLILFGDKPYLRAPLSHDLKAISRLIKSSEIALAGESTAIGEAIGLAIKRMQHLESQSRVIILLTDGANNEGLVNPRKAAELAALQGIKIYTIGIGGAESPAPNPYGVWSSEGAELYEKAVLKELADITQGNFFHVLDAQGLQAAYAKLDKLEPAFTQNINQYLAKPLYPWPLSLALLICLFGVWRGELPLSINTSSVNVRSRHQASSDTEWVSRDE